MQFESDSLETRQFNYIITNATQIGFIIYEERTWTLLRASIAIIGMVVIID